MRGPQEAAQRMWGAGEEWGGRVPDWRARDTAPQPSSEGISLPTFLTCWHQSLKSSSVLQKKP